MREGPIPAVAFSPVTASSKCLAIRDVKCSFSRSKRRTRSTALRTCHRRINGAEAIFCVHPITFQEVIEQTLIWRCCLTRRRLVPKVQDRAAMISHFSQCAVAYQPYDEIGVFKSVTPIAVVETVDSDNVVPPHSQIARLDPLPIMTSTIPPTAIRQGDELERTCRLVEERSHHPFRSAGLKFMAEAAIREAPAQPAPLPGHKPGLLGQTPVPCHEVGEYKAISVDEDDVVTPAPGNGQVARPGQPETVVVLAHMGDFEW